MLLQSAQAMLIKDRMDWRKPHLKWIASRYYRLFRQAKTSRG
ncbi:hypothetical protein Ga0609869_000482 [Rhodovulum iodosum]|uniref:Transposase n=1 Tax=Rhodovulum iodosum TaxID=68291 RepID=A0ABV3XQ01_9RHOB